MRMFFFLGKKQKTEKRERGEGGKNSKEREGSKRARHDLIHALTPDHPPLAEITGTIIALQFHNIKALQYYDVAILAEVIL